MCLMKISYNLGSLIIYVGPLKMMKKIIFISSFFLLTACSSTNTGMQFTDKSPRGIKVVNIMKEQLSKAYQQSEKHCAKYSKVPRILKKFKQADDSVIPMTTMVFECIRPSSNSKRR